MKIEFALLLAAFAMAACEPPLDAGLNVSLRSSTAGPPVVGAPVRWTIDAWNGTPGAVQYRFTLTADDGSLIARTTFRTSNSFDWIPLDEGGYTLTADVLDASTGETSQVQQIVTAVADQNPAQPGNTPGSNTPGSNPPGSNPPGSTQSVVGQAAAAPSNHPLVAVYTASCASGKMRVLYQASAADPSSAQATGFRSCRPGKTMAFLIGGLQADTDYTLRGETVDAAPVSVSDGVPFHTGTIPEELGITPVAIKTRLDMRASRAERVILQSFIGRRPGPAAFDLNGNPIWYYYDPSFPDALLLRPLAGGSMYVVSTDARVLRQIDLAGNVLREISISEASQQLQALEFPAITGFNHDAIRLPDGSTAVLASVEQFADQGDGPVDVDGDMVVVLDPDWHVVWAWNPFDKLDVMRKAVLNEQCSGPCATLAPVANDWTHANSLDYTSDGNLLVSFRSLDWIVKIDYRNGAGTGNVLWRLGRYGDFTTDSSDPFPWFSHQHFATLSGGVLTLFDNGNTRVAEQQGGESRGQVWTIDEAARTAHLELNVDLGSYSFALGSAEKLSNGDYEFLSGAIRDGAGFRAEATEVSPAADGAADFVYDDAVLTYRTFRMTDLYTPRH